MKRHFLYMVLFMLGCAQNPTIPVIEPELNITCVLNADSEVQKVYVDRTYSILEPYPQERETLWIPSEVKISSDVQEVVFYELCDTSMRYQGARIYKSESLLVEPGKTYRLEVSFSDSKKVAGETTVPQKPKLLLASGDTVKPEQRLSWESEGAGGYLIGYKFANLYDSEEDEYWGIQASSELGSVTSTRFDSLFIKYAQGYSIFRGGEKVTLWIAALDTNYYDYHQRVKNDETILPNMYLEGAIGVFGSCIMSDSTFFVIGE